MTCPTFSSAVMRFTRSAIRRSVAASRGIGQRGAGQRSGWTTVSPVAAAVGDKIYVIGGAAVALVAIGFVFRRSVGSTSS